ncbi:hypothetical protein FQR65_LT10093 [Abscondita terminalis]|nr:hypothetical protein FQR65_LT10093 [Abscondita terminalis]
MSSTVEKWLVVHFVSEGSVEIVPRKWYISSISKCYWPNDGFGGKIIEAIKKSYSPGVEWNLHLVHVLGEYDDFKMAERKVIKAKTSDKLTSSDNDEVLTKRRRRPKKRLYNSDTSSNDESDGIVFPEPPRKVQNRESLMKKSDDIEATPSTSQMMTTFTRSTEVELQTPTNLQLRPSSNNDNNEFQRRVLRELYLINAKLNEHSENFQVLIRNYDTSKHVVLDKESGKLDVLKYFPISTEEHLSEAERILLDKDQFMETAKYLSMFGGSEIKVLTKKIMYKMLSNEIGQLYNWEGTKKKKSFKSLLLAELIIKGVRLNPLTKDGTECEIIKYIKSWLVKAKERNLKMLLRTPPPATAESTNTSENSTNMGRLEQIMAEMALQMREIKEEIQNTRIEVRNANDQMMRQGEEIKALRSELNRKDTKWQAEKNKLEQELKVVKKKLELQEKGKKKNNIVIKGIEPEKEDIKQWAQEYLNKELDINIEVDSTRLSVEPEKKSKIDRCKTKQL